MRRIEPAESAVVIIDVQEKLAAAIPQPQLTALTRAATVLIQAAQMLGAEVFATEQYRTGLGHTIAPIRQMLEEAGAPIIEKMEFSACDAAGFERAWAARSPRVAVVVGM